MITIQLLDSGRSGQKDNLDECIQTVTQLEKLYSGKVLISYSKHTYGCTVVIRSNTMQGMNDTYRVSTAVGGENPATD